MSVGKAQNHPVLKPILDDNRIIFNNKNNDNDVLTLSLFMIYETTLGKDSYWFPYLRQMPIIDITCFWPTELLEET